MIACTCDRCNIKFNVTNDDLRNPSLACPRCKHAHITHLAFCSQCHTEILVNTATLGTYTACPTCERKGVWNIVSDENGKPTSVSMGDRMELHDFSAILTAIKINHSDILNDDLDTRLLAAVESLHEFLSIQGAELSPEEKEEFAEPWFIASESKNVADRTAAIEAIERWVSNRLRAGPSEAGTNMWWRQDPWVLFAVGLVSEMDDQCNRNGIPWDRSKWIDHEVMYFFLSFTLWSAIEIYGEIDKQRLVGRTMAFHSVIANNYSKFTSFDGNSSMQRFSHERYIVRERFWFRTLVDANRPRIFNFFRSPMKSIARKFIVNTSRYPYSHHKYLVDRFSTMFAAYHEAFKYNSLFEWPPGGYSAWVQSRTGAQ